MFPLALKHFQMGTSCLSTWLVLQILGNCPNGFTDYQHLQIATSLLPIGAIFGRLILIFNNIWYFVNLYWLLNYCELPSPSMHFILQWRCVITAKNKKFKKAHTGVKILSSFHLSIFPITAHFKTKWKVSITQSLYLLASSHAPFSKSGPGYKSWVSLV